MSKYQLIDDLFFLVYLICTYACIYIRWSISSSIYLLLGLIAPICHSNERFSPLYFLGFLTSFGINIAQLYLNVKYINGYFDEINLTSSSSGCDSISDMYKFNNFGFAWFSCDTPREILRKSIPDLIIMTISFSGMMYKFLYYNEQWYCKITMKSFRLNHKIESLIGIIIYLLNLICRIMVIIIPLINPALLTLPFLVIPFLYIIFTIGILPKHPDLKKNRNIYLIQLQYKYILYFLSIVYVLFFYLYHINIIRQFIYSDSKIAMYLKIGVFSPLRDNNKLDVDNYNALFFVNVSCYIILFICIYSTIIYDNTVQTNSVKYIHDITKQWISKLKLLVKNFVFYFALVGTFFWSTIFPNYLSSVLLLPSLFFLMKSQPNRIKLIYVIFLTCYGIFSIIFQFIFIVFYCKDSNLEIHFKYLEIFGIYSNGFPPFLMISKFFLTVLYSSAIAPLWDAEIDTENGTSRKTFSATPTMYYSIHLISSFSLIVLPLIEFYNDQSSLHSTILLAFFLLLTILYQKFKCDYSKVYKALLYSFSGYFIFWIIGHQFMIIFFNILNMPQDNFMVSFFFDLFEIGGNRSLYLKPLLLYFILILFRIQIKFYDRYQHAIELVSKIKISPYFFELTKHYPLNRRYGYKEVDDIRKFIIKSIFYLNAEQYALMIPTYQKISLWKLIQILLYSLLSHIINYTGQILNINKRFIYCILTFYISLISSSIFSYGICFFSLIFMFTREWKQFLYNIITCMMAINILAISIYNINYFPTLNYYLSLQLCNMKNALTTSQILFGVIKNQYIFYHILKFLILIILSCILKFISQIFEKIDINSETPERTNLGLLPYVSPENFDRSLLSSLCFTINNFFEFFGHESVMITGLLTVASHLDIFSFIHIIFLFLLFITYKTDTGINTLKKHPYRRIIHIYSYFILIIINLRYILCLNSWLISCIDVKYIHNQGLSSFLKHILFTQTTFEITIKKCLLLDFIHFVIIFGHFYNLKEESLSLLLKSQPFKKYHAKKLTNILYTNSIYISSFSIYIIAFQKIHFFNLFYMILCVWFLYYEKYIKKNLLYFASIIHSLQLLPLIVITIKLLFYIIFCIDNSSYEMPAYISNFFFRDVCPIKLIYYYYYCSSDVLILAILFLQYRILLSLNSNSPVISYKINNSSKYGNQNRNENGKNVENFVNDFANKTEWIENIILQKKDGKVDINDRYIKPLYEEYEKRNKKVSSNGARNVNDADPVPVKQIIFDFFNQFLYNDKICYENGCLKNEKIILLIGKILFFSRKNIWRKCIQNTNILLYFALIINLCYSASIISLLLSLSFLLYANPIKEGPCYSYWRFMQIYIQITATVRYFFTISPLDSLLTCSTNCLASTSSMANDTPLCFFRIFGVDGCGYSFYPDLFLLFAIQLHVIALEYRGVLILRKNDNQLFLNCFSWEYMTKTFGYIFEKFKYQSINDGILNVEKVEGARDNSLESNPAVVFDCRQESDYYFLLISAQFISMIILAFSWDSFFSPTIISGNIAKIITGSVVPSNFVFLMFVHIVVIIIDRSINIRKDVKAKHRFTVLIIILIHIWLFFIVPYKTNRKFYENTPVIFFYFFYAVYFYASYVPIKNGYSTRNVCPYSTFTQKHNYLTYGALKIILNLPFLLEIDSTLRWSYSKTVLNLSQFLKIDDIYLNVHILKSLREQSGEKNSVGKNEYSSWRKTIYTFFAVGVGFFFILAPLLFFAETFIKYISILPSQIDFSISINGYYPIYESTIIRSNFQIIKSTEKIKEMLESVSETQQHYATSMLYGYRTSGEIIKVEFSKSSYSSWSISPPARERMIEDIRRNISEIVFRLRFKIRRESSEMGNVIGPEQSEGSFLVHISNGKTNSTLMRNRLVDILEGKSASTIIWDFLPFLIRVEHNKPMYEYLPELFENPKKSVCAVRHDEKYYKENRDEWWDFTFLENEKSENQNINDLVCDSNLDKKEPMHTYFFIDFLISSVPRMFGTTSAVALYIIILGSLSSFVKRVFTSTSHEIMYSEWPDANFIVSLCDFVYIARENKNIIIEKILVDILIFLYRSPETLIKVTNWIEAEEEKADFQNDPTKETDLVKVDLTQDGQNEFI